MAKPSKKQLIDFILSHETHYTQNSWNLGRGYSHNVKIPNLPLSHKEREKLHEIISDEYLAEDFYFMINEIISDWNFEMGKKHGFVIKNEEVKTLLKVNDERRERGQTHEFIKKNVEHSKFNAYFAGRSGGHLVLAEYNGYNYGSSNWTFDEDELEEMNYEEVKKVYDILKDFEKLYNELVEIAKNFANTEIVEEVETTERKIKRFKTE